MDLHTYRFITRPRFNSATGAGTDGTRDNSASSVDPNRYIASSVTQNATNILLALILLAIIFKLYA